jgi:lysophospholipase L1-like esterase
VRRLLLPLFAVLVLWTGAGSAAALNADTSSTGQAAQRSAKRALFFGDSYFVGGGCSPDRNRGMAHIAAVDLGYRPTITGAGGTGFVAANPDYGIPPYLKQIHDGAFDIRDPSLVVIEGGSNDIGYPLREIRRNAKKVLLIARNRFPHALLVLVGPMQTVGPYSETNDIRDGLKAVARRLGIRYINDQKWTKGHDDWLCSDYEHPTYAAHKILGDRLARALAARGA